MTHPDAMPEWRTRVAAVLGPLRATRPLGGSAFAVEAGRRHVVVKLGPGVTDEAAGLRRLDAVAGAPPVPEVVLAEDELLVTSAITQVPRGDAHDETLGRSLAALHRAPCAQWGGGSSWIGACTIDASPWPDAAAFYGARLGELARRCGLERTIEPVVHRLGELLPPDGPALLHGDLWWGNVLAGADGRSWLIDPSVHGGHPEEDLAMLALFGPVPARLRDAYAEVFPPEADWEERVALFQLPPLLVHTVLFGGGYRTRAVSAARRYT